MELADGLRGMRPIMATYRYGISIDFRRLVGQGAGRGCGRKVGSSARRPLIIAQLRDL
jgi:hypothetical protein